MSDNQVSYTDDGKVKLYVGSLPFDTRSPDLEEMFMKYGNVSSAHVVMEKDNDTRSRGFGFVQFDTLEEAEEAIKGLNETPLGHRHIMVQHAGKPASGRPPQRRGGGGDRGGFRGRGGRGGFGDRGGRGGRGGGRGRGRGGYDRGGRGGGSYGGYNQRGGYGGDNGGGYGGQGGYNQSSGYGSQGGYNQSSGYGSQGGYNQGGNSGQGRSDWY